MFDEKGLLLWLRGYLIESQNVRMSEFNFWNLDVVLVNND